MPAAIVKQRAAVAGGYVQIQGAAGNGEFFGVINGAARLLVGGQPGNISVERAVADRGAGIDRHK